MLKILNTEVLRVAEINKYAKIAPDFGSPSRRANGSILSICDFWCNAEGGPKDKQDCGFICFRGPYIATLEISHENQKNFLCYSLLQRGGSTA